MEFHYTGQLKGARKLMIKHFKKNPNDVALMSDSEIHDVFTKEFKALQLQEDDCTIYLIPRGKFGELVKNGTIECLCR